MDCEGYCLYHSHTELSVFSSMCMYPTQRLLYLDKLVLSSCLSSQPVPVHWLEPLPSMGAGVVTQLGSISE